MEQTWQMKSGDVFNPAVRKAMSRMDLSQEELLLRLGCSRRSLVDSFSMEKMCELELLLDTPANELWNISGPEQRRLLQLARKNFEKRFCTEEAIDWAQRFPVRELQMLGFICGTEGKSFERKYKSGLLPRELMKFMGVVSVEAWKKAYAVTQGTVNPHAYSAWIRLGELQAKRPSGELYLFREIIANNMTFLRRNAFMLRENLRQVVIDTLKKCDIAVLQVPAFITAPVPRAAFFWKGLRPVLLLPQSRVSDSDFLEAVSHMVGHILQSHSKRPCLLAPRLAAEFAEGCLCEEAERTAERLLLTEAEECEIICTGHFAERRCIEFFSGKFHVRPGVIVSRLQQQKKIPAKSPLNALKVAV